MATQIPQVPFDGQIFIDAYRIKWVYNSDSGCWSKRGSLPKFPDATEEQRGLLSPTLKRVIDSIPEAGGHFSFVVDPKLSAVPHKHTALLKSTVIETAKNDAGSSIKIFDNASDGMDANEYAGKIVLFKNGLLNNKTLFITSNDETTIYVQGPDATQSKIGDKLEIIDSTAMNKDGLIHGDIVLTSESLDITFIDGNGNEIDGDCKVIRCDNADNPPGIDIKLSDKFINEFCVQIPGCKGPKGNRGEKGPKGADGTGDGPSGEDGDAGANATVPHVFTGVKIKDITDIFDTAVVGVNLDAAKGKLHVTKARVKTADNSKPADQVIASAISRGIVFTNDDFEYEIIMPNGDPINNTNVTILHYPESFSAKESAGDNKPESFTIWNLKLKSLIDALIVNYKEKLTEIATQYDTEIKPYVESKDKEARTILAELADDVAQCEFQLPIEFCMSAEPQGDCGPKQETMPTPGPIGEILGGDLRDGNISELPPVVVRPRIPHDDDDDDDDDDLDEREPTDPPATPTDLITGETGGQSEYPGSNNDGVYRPTQPNIIYGSATSQPITYADGTPNLPAGTYIVQWVGGSGRVNDGPFNVGVTIEYTDDTGTNSVAFTEPEEVKTYNWDAKAYSESRKKLSLDKNIVSFTLTTPGSAIAKFELDGDNPTGSVKLKTMRVFTKDEKDLPIPIQQNIVRGEVEGTGSGEPTCDQVVDCGDNNQEVNCPECPPQIQITQISPSSVVNSTPTSVVFTGSGFVDPVDLYINGSLMTLASQTNSMIVAIVLVATPGVYDVEINMGDSVTYAPNGITIT